MLKITFFEAGAEEAASLRAEMAARPEFKDTKVTFTEATFDATTASSTDADVISTFIYSKADKAAIDAVPGLTFITTRSTGFDHIDRGAAGAKGIKVSNVPSYGSHTIAEFTFALLLSVTRRIWDGKRGEKGFDLYGKTIGIVGTGRIGQCAIEIARGFGMKVIAYDAFQNADAAKRLGFTYVPLDELLSAADVISLHVPGNKDTRHLINKNNIAKIKRGAILVNTARGEVCDSSALIQALDEGILGGAGLDVVDDEQGAGKPLFTHPKAYVTPHMAYFTKEAEDDIVRTTIENIAAFIQGAPKNVVS